MSSVAQKEESQLHKLLLGGKRYSLNKKQIIQSTEDRQVVNVIVSGFFRKYLIDNSGSIGVQIIYGPGDIFPITLIYRRLFDQSLYGGLETFFYEAMSGAVVYSVPVDQLLQAVKADSQLYIDLLQEVGRHLEFCIHSLENVSLRNSEKRIAHLLWYFGDKFGTRTPGGVHINAPMTHQNIGEVLNITRETVTTNLGSLRDQGLVKTGKSLIIPDLEKLQQAAYS